MSLEISNHIVQPLIVLTEKEKRKENAESRGKKKDGNFYKADKKKLLTI